MCRCVLCVVTTLRFRNLHSFLNYAQRGVRDTDHDKIEQGSKDLNSDIHMWHIHFVSSAIKEHNSCLSHFLIPQIVLVCVCLFVCHNSIMSHHEPFQKVENICRTWSNKKTADMDGLRYSPDDPYYRLGPVHTWLYVRVRETGDWDLFLVPLEWERETGGDDWWVLQRRGFPGVARLNKVTPVSDSVLGIPNIIFQQRLYSQRRQGSCWIITIMSNQLLHDQIILCECHLPPLLPLPLNRTAM